MMYLPLNWKAHLRNGFPRRLPTSWPLIAMNFWAAVMSQTRIFVVRAITATGGVNYLNDN